MVKHKLQAGEYNVRRGRSVRKACAKSCPRRWPTIGSLRDVEPGAACAESELAAGKTLYPAMPGMFVSENQRVQKKWLKLFEQGKTEGAARVDGGHRIRALRDDYEISCREPGYDWWRLRRGNAVFTERE